MGDMADHFREMEEQDLFERRLRRAQAVHDREEDRIGDVPRWYNALGEEVDLDDIDREYALNILQHYTLNAGALGRGHLTHGEDPLVVKLRDVILNGREPNYRDRQRAKRYNNLNEFKGLPWRAMFKDLHKDG